MNVISKTINTLAHIIHANIAGYKASVDIRLQGCARDQRFVNSFFIGDKQVVVWVSDMMVLCCGGLVDCPNAVCIFPQTAKGYTNRYHIYLSSCTLNYPAVCDAAIAHECGHIICRHLDNAAIARDRSGIGVLRDAESEIEADRLACELGFSDELRKLICGAKESGIRIWGTGKYTEIFDARLAALDEWTANFRK